MTSGGGRLRSADAGELRQVRLYPLVELTLCRFREFLREPEAVFWVFAFPVIMTCALGIAFRSRGAEPVIAGVVEQAGADEVEIGRASCRERGEVCVGAGAGRRNGGR